MVKLASCFVNNLAMCLGVHLVGLYEGKGTGINFSNWNRGANEEDTFAFTDTIYMMFLNNFIQMLLAYYMDQVKPGDHGIAKPWNFLFWHKTMLTSDSGVGVEGDCVEEGETYFEDESAYSTKNIGIKITNIFKIFKQLGSVKHAVKNLTLNIYEGHITVLLGE